MPGQPILIYAQKYFPFKFPGHQGIVENQKVSEEYPTPLSYVDLSIGPQRSSSCTAMLQFPDPENLCKGIMQQMVKQQKIVFRSGSPPDVFYYLFHAGSIFFSNILGYAFIHRI